MSLWFRIFLGVIHPSVQMLRSHDHGLELPAELYLNHVAPPPLRLDYSIFSMEAFVRHALVDAGVYLDTDLFSRLSIFEKFP